MSRRSFYSRIVRSHFVFFHSFVNKKDYEFTICNDKSFLKYQSAGIRKGFVNVSTIYLVMSINLIVIVFPKRCL